jgi:hypothetical protein
VPHPQDSLEPAEKQFHAPAIPVSKSYQVRFKVHPVRRQQQHFWLAVRPRLACRHLDHAQLLFEDLAALVAAQPHHQVALHPCRSRLVADRSLFNHLPDGVFTDATDEGTLGVDDVLEQLIVRVAAVFDVQASGLQVLPQLLGFRAVPLRNADADRDAAQYLEVNVHLGGTVLFIQPQSPGHSWQSRQKAAIDSG